MRRTPNPWIAIPALLMGLLAGALGWVVTDVSCRQPDADGFISPCYGWAGLIGVVSFIAAAIGVAVLLALVYRSLAEWREREERGRETP